MRLLRHPCHAAATCRPDAPAVTQGAQSWRYGEFSRRVAATAAYLLAHIRRAAELGWEFGGAPADVVAAGFVMWALLMEALRRTVAAEEAAAKAGVKMVLPLFLLFASIMLLVMGPMLLKLAEQE